MLACRFISNLISPLDLSQISQWEASNLTPGKRSESMLGRGRGDRGLGLRVGNYERRTGRVKVGEQGKKSVRKKGERGTENLPIQGSAVYCQK